MFPAQRRKINTAHRTEQGGTILYQTKMWEGRILLGYVRAFKPELKIKDYEIYRGIYCSLCHTLGKNYSPVARLFLSYDFAFAAILRLAVSESACGFCRKRCPYNPTKKCMVCAEKKDLDFCSHALIITVYHKIKDDLSDAGLKSKIAAAIVFPVVALMHKKAARLAPEIEKIISDAMKSQSKTEKKKDVCLDEAAHASSDALGKVFALGFTEKTADSLYSLGYMTGRFIYILDAVDDLDSDIKKGNFNPFAKNFGNIRTPETRKAFAARARETLNLTQSGALDAFDGIDTKRFENILENIVFDGFTFSSEKVLKKYEEPHTNTMKKNRIEV